MPANQYARQMSFSLHIFGLSFIDNPLHELIWIAYA